MKKIFVFLAILTVGFLGFYLYKDNSASEPAINFIPQKIQAFNISSEKNTELNILAGILPQFDFNLTDEKFNNIWQSHAQERKDMIETSVINVRKDSIIDVKTKFDDSSKKISFTPESTNKFKPGLYKLDVKVKTVKGEYITITQDFTWGVLAVNTNKAIYQTGETVTFHMGVLDDIGDTKCIAEDGIIKFETARVWLTIISPSGKKQNLSTDDGTISGSRECGPKTVTNNPDFYSEIKAAEVGKYKILMEVENINGRRSIEDFFTVQNTAPRFDIERVSYPTRIYPKADYPVEIKITANEDYSGSVVDIVPDSFVVSEISENGSVRKRNEEFDLIQWNVDWKKGETYSLSYTITFPPISPEFYLVGPLTIGDFKEKRNWQIASDAVFALIQEAHATANSTSVSVSFGSATDANHLALLICYSTTQGGGLIGGGTGFNTPGGYSVATNTTGSGPMVYVFYKISVASEGSATCQLNGLNPSSQQIGIQRIEFSGNSSTSVLDVAATPISNSNACNSSPFQSATNSLTPTNPNELILSAFSAASTTARTVSSHSSGYTDTDINGGSNGFNAGNSTFDSGYGEKSASTSDTITYSGAAVTCSNALVSFKTGLYVAQGSYRFFTDSGTIAPGTALAASQNTPAQLVESNKFRLRLLLRQNSASGTTMAVDGGNFKLQYAVLSGSCAASSYSDVTTTSTISYIDNTGIAVGTNISSNGSDPSDSGSGYTTVMESFYDDPNTGGTPPNVTNDQNPLTPNQAGLWDFLLLARSTPTQQISYCFRIVNGDGTVLYQYNQYPEIRTSYSEVNIFGGTTIRGGTKIY